VTGIPYKKVGYVETLEAAKAHPHYNAPLGGPNRGRGVATAVCNNITGPACAVVSLQQDGSVGLVEGSADLAGSRTAAAMHVAEVLGITAEEVHPSVGDTDSIGYTAISAGSSAVYKTGWASFEAARGTYSGSWRPGRRSSGTCRWKKWTSPTAYFPTDPTQSCGSR